MARMTTGEQEWRAVAYRLAERVAALQNSGEAGSEIVARAYDTRSRLYGGTREEVALLGKVWTPTKGGPLYYGELTAQHVENIIAFAQEQVARVEQDGKGLFGWTPQQMERCSKWTRIWGEMLHLKARRQRHGVV